ncbi:MAG: hypothetical protein WCV69_02925 [Patescibacteria group bacterium]|jgi:hypothetical protein
MSSETRDERLEDNEINLTIRKHPKQDVFFFTNYLFTIYFSIVHVLPWSLALKEGAMSRFALLVGCLLCLAMPVFGNNEPSVMPLIWPTLPNNNVQCLIQGSGVISPYQIDFVYLVLYEAPDQVYLVFSYPLDPAQRQELTNYQRQQSLDWDIRLLQIDDVYWTAIGVTATGETQALIRSLLDHLRRQSFVYKLQVD